MFPRLLKELNFIVEIGIPFSTLIAVCIFFIRLSHKQEILALRTSFLSIHHIYKALFIVSFIGGVIIYYNESYLAKYLNNEMLRSYKQQKLPGYYFQDNHLFFIDKLNNDSIIQIPLSFDNQQQNIFTFYNKTNSTYDKEIYQISSSTITQKEYKKENLPTHIRILTKQKVVDDYIYLSFYQIFNALIDSSVVNKKLYFFTFLRKISNIFIPSLIIIAAVPFIYFLPRKGNIAFYTFFTLVTGLSFLIIDQIIFQMAVKQIIPLLISPFISIIIFFVAIFIFIKKQKS